MNRKKTLFLILFPLLYNVWNEGIFSLFLKQGVTLHKILFALLGGVLLYWIGQWMKNRRLAFRIQTVLALVYTVIYGAQLSYYTLFETPFYLKSLSGAGDTMSDFFDVVVDAVLAVWLPMTLLLLFFLLWMTLYRRIFLTVEYSEKRSWRSAVAFVLGLCSIFGFCTLDYSGAVSPSYMMLYEFVPTESVRQFGMFPTVLLDIKYNLLHLQTTRKETIHLDMNELEIEPVVEVIENESTEAYEEASTEEAADREGAVEPEFSPEPMPEQGESHDNTKVDESAWPASIYNAMDLDFTGELGKDEDVMDEDFADMNAYFSGLTPTKKNEYTGMFAGKNLILITAEAFSTWVIDPELTPTLYKLANEGFQFNHFYNPIWGVSTSDGEFVATTGLIPKAGVWSYTEIADNYMPFAFGNQFSRLDYITQAFHNHSYTYYNRDRSYPNMGYDFYAKGHGLNITDTWPESDVEMIKESFPLYAKGENKGKPFHVYYMSVSGHMEYTWDSNMMSYINKDRVAHLGYSEEVSAYLACQLELEDALTELLKKLEKNGLLEDTVIALSPDHYPYGLTLEQYRELRGEDFDETFGLYENTFILWSGSMKEPISVDTYCSSLDIAPTLANLFGLEYDSRLYIGTDIFGDQAPIVCFQDRSFITDRIMYDNTNKKIIQLDRKDVSQDYLASCIAKVKNKFYYSAKIIENDYYGYLFQQVTDPEIQKRLAKQANQ